MNHGHHPWFCALLSSHMAGPLRAELLPRSHAHSTTVEFPTTYRPPPSTAALPVTDAPLHDTLPSPPLYTNAPKSALLAKKDPPVI